jgi:hypothetical protein
MYYFDVRDDGRLYTDGVGSDLVEQVGAVRTEALDTLLEYVKSVGLGSRCRRRVAVEVRNDSEGPFLTVEMMVDIKTQTRAANSRSSKLEGFERHFQEGEERLLRQRVLVQRLSEGGLPTCEAEQLLGIFESVQKNRARQMRLIQRWA